MSIISEIIPVSSKGFVFHKMNTIYDLYFLSTLVKKLKNYLWNVAAGARYKKTIGNILRKYFVRVIVLNRVKSFTHVRFRYFEETRRHELYIKPVQITE